MDQLIGTYLFSHKKCFLPGIGQLYVTQRPAENNFVDKAILAPYFFISFNNKGSEADSLVPFIAASHKTTQDEASAQLAGFCDEIKNELREKEFFHLTAVGDFSVLADGSIQFSEQKLPAYYFSSVHADRVIHPKSEHAMVVGDKESTNVAMTDLLAEAPVQKDRWWVWAIVLVALAALAMLFHYSSVGNPTMGNSHAIF